MKWLSASALALVIVGLGSSSASASMLGATINTCWNSVYSGTVTTDTAQCNAATVGFSTTSAVVVDPGVEFTIAGARDVDFSATTVTVRYSSFSGSSSPDLFIFSNLPGTVTGLTLLSSDQLGITTAFSGSTIGLLVSNPECCRTSTVSSVFAVEFGKAVPEPITATMLTLGTALAGLRFRRRR